MYNTVYINFSEANIVIAATFDTVPEIESTKDVDFRILPANTVTTPSGLSSIPSVISGPSIDSIKKRASEERIIDEPLAKKAKSEEIE